MTNPQSRTPQSRDALRKRADDHFQAGTDRATLAKQELAAERAASDAKTARLRALRLAKEAEDQESARLAAKTAPRSPARRNKPTG